MVSDHHLPFTILDLSLQPAKQTVNHGFTVFFVNRPSERNIHRAGSDAILGVSAICNSIPTHNSFEPFVTGHLSSGMHVEKPNLSYGLRSNVMVVFVLRAGLETTTTGHAARISIAFLDILLIHTRCRSKIMCTIQFDPRVNALEMIKHPRTINDQVANIWKF